MRNPPFFSVGGSAVEFRLFIPLYADDDEGCCDAELAIQRLDLFFYAAILLVFIGDVFSPHLSFFFP